MAATACADRRRPARPSDWTPRARALSDDPSLADLPERISLFGLTRLPASYVQALAALAGGRDVHLYLLHPSPALWRAVDQVTAGLGAHERSRAGGLVLRARVDTTGELAVNRLLALVGCGLARAAAGADAAPASTPTTITRSATRATTGPTRC